MWKKFYNNWLLSKIKDDKYKVLFEDAPNDEWVVFDCETTGLNVKTDEIISIGAVIIKDNTICTSKKFYTLAKPTKEMDGSSIRAHHLRNIDLQNARPVKEAIDDFIAFVGPRKLVGYYLEFDVGMVNKYLKQYANVKMPNHQTDISAMYFDYKIDPLGTKNVDCRFNSIMKDLALPLLGQHNAYSDALMTALAFVKLKNIK